MVESAILDPQQECKCCSNEALTCTCRLILAWILVLTIVTGYLDINSACPLICKTLGRPTKEPCCLLLIALSMLCVISRLRTTRCYDSKGSFWADLAANLAYPIGFLLTPKVQLDAAKKYKGKSHSFQSSSGIIYIQSLLSTSPRP